MVDVINQQGYLFSCYQTANKIICRFSCIAFSYMHMFVMTWSVFPTILALPLFYKWMLWARTTINKIWLWWPKKFSLLSHEQVYKIFEDEDPESALESAVDRNLRGSFPMDDVYKVSPTYSNFLHGCLWLLLFYAVKG